MKTTIFTEQLDLSEASIDSGERVLRNVVLIRAGLSKNKRNYPEAVLQAAAPVFEGTKAYDSHQIGARKVAETTGWYSAVRYSEGALRADRHFTRTQAGNDVWSIAEDIVSGRAPATLAGLSINAVGQGKTVKHADGDVLEVESITAANSVDDVDNPAAGGTYLAAGGGDALTASLLQAMTFEEFLEVRPDYVERLRKQQQAVRQEDALKAIQSEADLRVKTAESTTEQAVTALEQATDSLARLEADLVTAERQLATVSREAAVDLLLAASKLPGDWKADLRTALTEADPDEWDGILERETRKAQAAGHNPRVPVTGAGQQVQAADAEPTSKRRVVNWAEINTPEKHAAALKQLQENT